MLSVAAFYKFIDIENYKELKQPILAVAKRHGIKGTILLAKEGINSTIAGTPKGMKEMLVFLRKIPEFADLRIQESSCEEQPFLRMKVKLKQEIVTLGKDNIKPHENTGTYLNPKQWNELLKKEDTLVIDTRNTYETNIGTFKGATDPQTCNFRDFPEYVKDLDKEKPVAMFCTGGIRCEKASAYMLQEGFKQVYQLHGGITTYLRETDEADSLWEGECFIFDNRVSLNHKLEPGSFKQCYGCRLPLAPEDLKSEHYEAGVKCPHCFDNMTEEHFSRARSRQKQMRLAKQRNISHIGAE